MHNDILFRKLDFNEAAEFRQWARDEYAENYVPGQIMPIQPGVYHPVVNEQIEYINEKAKAASRCLHRIKRDLNTGRPDELMAFLMDCELIDLKRLARGDFDK